MQLENCMRQSEVICSKSNEMNEIIRTKAVINKIWKLKKTEFTNKTGYICQDLTKSLLIKQSVCNKNKSIKSAEKKAWHIWANNQIKTAARMHKKGGNELNNYLKINKLEDKNKKTRWQKIIGEIIEEQAQIKKKSNIKHRIEVEAKVKIKENWAPIFATLTCKNEDEVFKIGSNAFRVYIQNLRREIAIAEYGCKARDAMKYENPISYIAIVENGTKGTKRKHIHLMIWIKKIPEYLKPVKNYKHREIKDLKTRWEYGYSSLIAVRTERSDIWGKHGWLWPRTKKGPITEKPIDAVANYVSKYITKMANKGEKQWRTKMNRGFGMQLVEMMANNQTTQNLMIRSIGKVITKQMKGLKNQPTTELLKRYATIKYVKSERLNNNSIAKIIRHNLTKQSANMLSKLSINTTLTTMNHRRQKTGHIQNQEIIYSTEKVEDVIDCIDAIVRDKTRKTIAKLKLHTQNSLQFIWE